jgi:hypothetical protein
MTFLTGAISERIIKAAIPRMTALCMVMLPDFYG